MLFVMGVGFLLDSLLIDSMFLVHHDDQKHVLRLLLDNHLTSV